MAADTDGIHVGYNEQGTYDGRYPPDWDARKEAVKQRDHYTCQECGMSAGEGNVLLSWSARSYSHCCSWAMS